MPNGSKEPNRILGLFTGILNSADGSWILMSQLRRMSSVVAWMVHLVFLAYVVSYMPPFHHLFELEGSDLAVLCLICTVLLWPPISFGLFLWIGGIRWGVETIDPPPNEKPE